MSVQTNSEKPRLQLKETPAAAPVKAPAPLMPTAKRLVREVGNLMLREMERENPECQLLTKARESGAEIEFSFLNGVTIRSKIKAFGKYSIALADGSVIYKSALRSTREVPQE